MPAQVLQLHRTITLQQALDAFEDHLEEADLGAGTKDTYRKLVRYYSGFLADYPGAERAFADKIGAEMAARAWRDELLENRRRSPSYVQTSLAAVKLLYTAALYVDIKVKGVKQPKQGAPRALDRKDESRLRYLVDKLAESGHWKDIRNAALVHLLLDTGARIQECAQWDLADFTLSARKSRVRILGKGRKVRHLKLSDNARKRLMAWLKLREQVPQAQGSTKLWIGEKGPMTTDGLRRIIRDLGPMAKIEELSPHVLRHTFGTRLRQAGVDLVVIAELMGHESVTTTMRYTRPGEQEKDDVIDKVFG